MRVRDVLRVGEPANCPQPVHSYLLTKIHKLPAPLDQVGV